MKRLTLMELKMYPPLPPRMTFRKSQPKNIVSVLNALTADRTHNTEIQWVRQLVGNLKLSPGLNDQSSATTRATESMILQAGMSFAKSLIKETINVYTKQRQTDPPEEGKWKQLVPMHTIFAIHSKKNFDFLAASRRPQD